MVEPIKDVIFWVGSDGKLPQQVVDSLNGCSVRGHDTSEAAWNDRDRIDDSSMLVLDSATPQSLNLLKKIRQEGLWAPAVIFSSKRRESLNEDELRNLNATYVGKIARKFPVRSIRNLFTQIKHKSHLVKAC